MTKNHFGKGTAYYIGTQPEQRFLEELIAKICQECGIQPVYQAQEGIEITRRVSEKAEVIFMLNHKKEEAKVFLGEEILWDLLGEKELTGEVVLAAGDVIIAKKM